MADIGFQIPGIDSRSVFDIMQFDLIDEGEKTGADEQKIFQEVMDRS